MMRNLIALALCVALPVALCPSGPAQTGTGQGSGMMIPGLGSNFSFESENAVYQDGALHATGAVKVRSDQFDIDCDALVIDQENSLMRATGRRVQLQTENLTAIAGTLTYNLDTEEMVLEQGEAAERPCIIQQNEDGSALRSCASTIRLRSDEEGNSIFELNGAVEIQSEGAATQEQPSAFNIQPIQIPGLGENGSLICDSLIYRGTEGIMRARGLVEITTPTLLLLCEALDYDEAAGRMLATGDEVVVEKQDVEALCTLLTYFPDIGRILLDRRTARDPQPQMWEEREDGIFHATADQIILTELESGQTRVAFSQNYHIQTLPLEQQTAETGAGRPAVLPIESIDQLPGAGIDPRA